MSKEPVILTNRAAMLDMSNKTLPLCMNRLTIFISGGNMSKTKAEIKEIRKQLDEIEKLAKESEKLGEKPFSRLELSEE